MEVLLGPRSGAGALSALVLLLGPALAARPLRAQEFTRQSLFVAPFHGDSGSRAAQRVSSRLRGQLRRLVDRRSTYVYGSDSGEALLRGAGVARGAAVAEQEFAVLARWMRADEVVVGRVVEGAGGVEVSADLVLVRDWRMRQPLPVIRGATSAAAADSLAAAVMRARTQMTGLRRCENLGAEGDLRGAAREAERAVAGYARSTLARTCLGRILEATAAISPDSVLRVADAVLAVDTASIIALVLRANALEEAGRAGAAGESWVRALAIRGDSLALAARGVERLLQLERPALAARALVPLIAQHPGQPWLRRQLFRAQHELARWPLAAALGDSLDASDDEFRADSNYAVRHVEALRLTGDTLGAVAKSARSVRQHLGDARLYLQYVQLVGSESGVALLRGLERFPRSSGLRVVAAQQARATGDRATERTELGAAVAEDPSMGQGYLRIAELWFLDGHADSALTALGRAPRAGTGASLLRSYAIGRGVQLMQAAVDSLPATYAVPVGLLALADSVESRDDSRSLLAAALLQYSRSELVVTSVSRACDDARRADEGLGRVRTILDRGVGTGTAADELHAAHATLRTAIDDAVRLLCVAPMS